MRNKRLESIKKALLRVPTGYWLAILFVLILGSAYRAWIFTFDIMTKGDWGFFFKETMATLRLDYFGIWLSDDQFGRVLLDMGQAPSYAAYGFIARYFGYGYEVAERVVHFWPILILTPLGIYLLLQRMFKSPFARLIGVIAFCFNTYILILHTGGVTLAVAWAAVPLVLYFFQLALETKKVQYYVATALAGALCSGYEPRVFYILMWVLLFYTLYTLLFIGGTNAPERIKNILKQCFAAAVPVFLMVLLNVYWLIGLASVKGDGGQAIIKDRIWGTEFFDLQYATTLFHPFWQTPTPFVAVPIPFYVWLIPAFAIFGLFLWRKNYKVIFFGLLAVLGILLTKEAAAPFPELYQWLFKKLPGFNAYREPSKFYGLIAMSYAVLIAGMVEWLFAQWRATRSRRITTYIVTVLAALVFLINLVPFYNNQIGSLFIARSIPAQYQAFHDLLVRDTTFARTYWLPAPSRWTLNTALHPKVSDNADPFGVNDLHGDAYPAEARAGGIFFESYAANLFSRAAISLINIPTSDYANDDNLFSNKNRDFYSDLLDNVPWLTKGQLTGDNPLGTYSNSRLTPYFSAFTKLTSLNPADRLSAKSTFITNTLNAPIDYVDSGNDPIKNQSSLIDLLDDLKPSQIKQGVLSINTAGQNDSSNLYTRASLADLAFAVNGQFINFYQSNNATVTADGVVMASPSAPGTLLAQTALQNGVQYFIAQGNKLLSLDRTSSRTRYINASNGTPVIASFGTQNLIPNGSLANGLWQKNVEDCNNFDKNPLFGMQLIKDDVKNRNVLSLNSSNHTACTGPDAVSVVAGQSYRVSFDYRVVSGRYAGYEIEFNNADKTTVREYRKVTNAGWRTENYLVAAPAGATQMRIRLKAFQNEQQPVRGVARYTDLAVYPQLTAAAPFENSAKEFKAQGVDGASKIQVSNPDTNKTNLIENPSLEKGLWKKDVGDCNAYDDKPEIRMKLNNAQYSDGVQSLELSAKSHIACTGPSAVSVKESHQYLFSFDYQSPNAEGAIYSINFNDADRTRISGEQIRITDDKWHSYSKVIEVPYGATTASITLSAAASVDAPGRTILNRYDNLSMFELPATVDEYYLSSEPNEPMVAPKSVDFKLISPTKKTVKITGATGTFYLVMSEKYHPQWALDTGSGRLTPTEVNGFENGWYIDPAKVCSNNPQCTKNADGSYDMKMVADFTPQSKVRMGILVSVVTLLACVLILVGSFVIPKVRKKYRAR